jgi:hypothetical protein
MMALATFTSGRRVFTVRLLMVCADRAGRLLWTISSIELRADAVRKPAFTLAAENDHGP